MWVNLDHVQIKKAKSEIFLLSILASCSKKTQLLCEKHPSCFQNAEVNLLCGNKEDIFLSSILKSVIWI